MDESLKYIFVAAQTPKRQKKKNVLSGGRGEGGAKVEKWFLLEIESSVDLHAVSHSTLQRLQNVIK